MSDEYGTPIPPIEETQTSNNSRVFIIIAIVLVVLCCCCIGVSALFYFVLGDPLIEVIDEFTWAPMLLSML